jgi:glutaminyl-peptide cyclotransferase
MKLLKRSNSILWLVALCSIIAACNNDTTPKKPINNEPPPSGDVSVPAVIAYDIIKEYPHDANAFTEGLEFREGILYESTGQYGQSDVRKVELNTGKVILSKKMEHGYFGEGLTVLNGKIYQLTYREGKGFVYDTATLKVEKTFAIASAEGWGITNNGTSLIYDDGGSVFHFIDPVTFKEHKQLKVTDEHGPVNELNEPELIHGFIYANQWKTELILKIDTATGKVVGRADLSNLRERAGIAPISNNGRGPDVLNGIAYDAANNKIYITGKNWPKLFEIRLDN